MSASLMLLFELEYIKRLQCVGWNSVAVITSVSSSMLTGLISTISEHREVPISNMSAPVNFNERTEALVADVEIPKVDPQIVSRYVCFLVRIDRDGMYMIGVGIRIHLSRHGSDNVVLQSHARQSQMTLYRWRRKRALSIMVI